MSCLIKSCIYISSLSGWYFLHQRIGVSLVHDSLFFLLLYCLPILSWSPMAEDFGAPWCISSPSVQKWVVTNTTRQGEQFYLYFHRPLYLNLLPYEALPRPIPLFFQHIRKLNSLFNNFTDKRPGSVIWSAIWSYPRRNARCSNLNKFLPAGSP